ncbi:MAG: lipid-A-disaccharide synthase [Calditrichaeota bacterium]|nr:MAG: lipid-A-disaccharide synthase [Calditrichota bacterium]
MKVMIVAGEASGDLHGGALVSELKKLAPESEIFGIGGERMRQAGMHLLFHVQDMAVMGFSEVVSKLPFFYKVRIKLLQEIKKRNPDLLILIDYPGFNIRLAKKIRALNLPIMYYIAPQVWAWGARRLNQLARWIHTMVVVLPFEKSLWEKTGIPTYYVGHPLLERLKVKTPKNQFFKKYGLDLQHKLVGLLPGSRESEVRRLLPEMLRTITLLQNQDHSIQALIGKADTVDQQVYAKILSKAGIKIILCEQIYDLMKYADALIVASGTATLEAAFFQTPMVVVYRVSNVSYWLASRLVKVPNIALANIIAGDSVVPEFIQNDFNANNLTREVLDLLYNENRREKMIEGLVKVKQRLGPTGASKKVAKIAVQLAKKAKNKGSQ